MAKCARLHLRNRFSELANSPDSKAVPYNSSLGSASGEPFIVAVFSGFCWIRRRNNSSNLSFWTFMGASLALASVSYTDNDSCNVVDERNHMEVSDFNELTET
jgi:hypothetical protein